MKYLRLLTATALLTGMTMTAHAETVSRNFDAGWLFSRGDTFGGDIAGAEQTDARDSDWQKISLPNDWEINGPYDKLAPATGAGAFLPTGVA